MTIARPLSPDGVAVTGVYENLPIVLREHSSTRDTVLPHKLRSNYFETSFRAGKLPPYIIWNSPKGWRPEPNPWIKAAILSVALI
jgi:hypothetical protein